MRGLRVAAAAVLSLGTAVFPAIAAAQDTLISLLKAGNREAVLAAITSPDIEINEAEPDGSTVLHWATYRVDHELVGALLDAGAKADVTNNFGSTPLTEAVKLGDADLVRMLLDGGADPNSPNQDNQTALMLASFIGSEEIARMLLDKGADVNAVETFRGQTALMWAVSENHPDVAELLIARGADVSIRAKHDDWPRQMTSEPRAQYRATGGLTALLYAARSGCYRCAVAIVEAGADVNRPNPDGVTPLINALDNRSFDIAMYLMDQGANIHVWDMYGRTPIYVAVDMNTFTPGGFAGFGGAAAPRDPIDITAMDVVHRLLNAGVNVNHQLTQKRPNGAGRGRFGDYMMRGGTGPLFRAVLSHDHEAIEMLLAHGAEVDLPNVFQITPLMAAAGVSGTAGPAGGGGGGGGGGDAQARALRTVDMLLDAGADINIQITDSRTHTATLQAYVQGRDREGQTALFGAAALGYDRLVARMLERGADPTIRDAEGSTALDEAMRLVGAGSAGGGPRAPDGGPNREATIALLEAAIAEAAARDL